jgi:hypothetical protein
MDASVAPIPCDAGVGDRGHNDLLIGSCIVPIGSQPCCKSLLQLQLNEGVIGHGKSPDLS